MIKTNLLQTQPSCEQEYTPVCTDDGILFGPKTGKKVVLSLMDGELIRLDAFNIQAPIKIYLLDRDPGAACADCGTGFKKPYAPCGDCSPKELTVWNTTEYVRGPGVFEFASEGIAGTPFVKMVELNSIPHEEFCKKCNPPCPSMRIDCDGGYGYGYHISDPKDPAATVEMPPCEGDTSADSIWIYPNPAPGRTVKITDCDGTLIGYAVNRSDCAPA